MLAVYSPPYKRQVRSKVENTERLETIGYICKSHKMDAYIYKRAAAYRSLILVNVTAKKSETEKDFFFFQICVLCERNRERKKKEDAHPANY